MAKYRQGSEVEWKWGRSFARGRVALRFTTPVSRVIKGKRIVRRGSPDNPAYLVKMEDGRQVLKLESELQDGKQKHGWA